jgi:hypothetical protein
VQAKHNGRARWQSKAKGGGKGGQRAEQGCGQGWAERGCGYTQSEGMEGTAREKTNGERRQLETWWQENKNLASPSWYLNHGQIYANFGLGCKMATINSYRWYRIAAIKYSALE